MSPFLESIAFLDEQMPLLKWHQQRFVRTQQTNWQFVSYLDLGGAIRRAWQKQRSKKDSSVPVPAGQLYKCRVIYAPEAMEISFSPYQQRTIRQLLVKEAPDLRYDFKSADRTALDRLTADLPPDTEILITQQGYLTDSSFSNLAFFDGKSWVTPGRPLLAGVHRQQLLEQGQLRTAIIRIEDLHRYEKIRLINAMVSWENSWELPLGAVIL